MSSVMLEREYILVPDVTKLFGWKRCKVYSLIRKRKIVASKDGKYYTVSVASIYKHLKRYQTTREETHV